MFSLNSNPLGGWHYYETVESWYARLGSTCHHLVSLRRFIWLHCLREIWVACQSFGIVALYNTDILILRENT